MAKKTESLIEELTKAAAQYTAMKATHAVAGGGIGGYLLSMAAMKGVEKLFEKPKKEAEKKEKPDDGKPTVNGYDLDVDRRADRIGDAVAKGFEKAIAEVRKKDEVKQKAEQPASSAGQTPESAPKDSRHNPDLDDFFGRPTASKPQPDSGPSPTFQSPVPRPGESQSAREYVRSLNPEQLYYLRNPQEINGDKKKEPPPSNIPSVDKWMGRKDIPKPDTVTERTTSDSVREIERNTVRNTVAEAESAAAGRAAASIGQIGGTVAGAAGRAAAAAGGAGGGAGAAGGAAAAGGGAAAGAGVGGAMAAAAPVALPIIAVTAFGLACYEAAKMVKDLAYGQEQLSKRLGEVNPIIGGQQQELDMQRLFRDMRSGDKLSGSNADLLGAINRFEEKLRPFEDLANQIKNAIATDLLTGITNLIDMADNVGGNIHDTLAKIANEIPGLKLNIPSWEEMKKGNAEQSTGFGDFLKEIHDQEQMKHQQHQARINNARNALDRAASW